MKYRLISRIWVLVTALSTLAAQGGEIQDPSFSKKPIAMVVAGPPAGGTDAIARVISSEISQSIGQNVIVDNKAGASGIIGTKYVAGANPDGYTMLMGHVATNAIVPALIKPRPYDPVADFVPVSLIGTAPDVLVVSASSGIRNLDDLLAKGKGGSVITYGSPGVGLPQHIAGFALAKASGVQMQHVPYKGSAPALTDLIGGQITMMFVTPGAAVPFLKSGKLRALAVTSHDRSRFFPDLPTMRELGYPMVEEVGWFGVFLPAGTQSDISIKLHGYISKALATKEVRQKLESMYLEPSTGVSELQFQSFVKSEVKHWQTTVDRLGVAAE